MRLDHLLSKEHRGAHPDADFPFWCFRAPKRVVPAPPQRPSSATGSVGFPATAGGPLLVGHSVIRLPSFLHREVEAPPPRGQAQAPSQDGARRPDTLFSREGARPSSAYRAGEGCGAPWRKLFENCIASMESLEFSIQATKGLRWMPWRREPMKDAAGCESPGKLPSKL